MNAHHSFLGLIDKLFPRKTMEQMLEQLTPMHNAQGRSRQTSGGDLRELADRTGSDSLAAPIAELTTAVRSLTKWSQDEQTTAQRAATELPRVLREEFTAPMKALNDSLRDLTKLMKEAHIDRVRATATLDDLMSRLTDRVTEQRTPSDPSRAEGRRFWPKRSIVSSGQPTA
jgi:hypothetical protein